jgi:ribosome-associated protein
MCKYPALMTKNEQRTKTAETEIEIIVKAIQNKKGKEIVSLNLQNIQHAICDYFIVCHGLSHTQVVAISDSVQKEMQEIYHTLPWYKEGCENAEWILIDYLDVVVHIFQEPTRKYYDLEKLWGDAKTIHYSSD